LRCATAGSRSSTFSPADEGHGFARPINNLALLMESEKFLAQHLSGRYQEGGTAEEVGRLKEITVDPKTVVLVKKIDIQGQSVPPSPLSTCRRAPTTIR
jgi:hypothetical protein